MKPADTQGAQRGRSKSKALQPRHGPEANPPNRQPEERVRTVRFEGPLDALDQLLRRSQIGRFGEAAGAEVGDGQQELDNLSEGDIEYDGAGVAKPRKSWKVSNAQLRRKIAELAAADEGSGGAARGASGSNWRSAGPGAAAGAAQGDDRILVNVFIAESGDTMTLRVSPELKLGPAKPPPTNVFTEVFGQGASTKGFDKGVRSFDYRRREFGSTQRPGWNPAWQDSLKEMISKVMNVSPDRQRLNFKNAPITADELTLRSYGIDDGDTVQLSIRRPAGAAAAPGAQRSVTLACTRRKQEVQRRRQEQEAAGVALGCGAPFLRDSTLLKHCRHDSDVWMMPRWISQSNPNLFAPVGVGIDGEGGTKACQEFGSAPTFVPYDGQLARVREVAGIKC